MKPRGTVLFTSAELRLHPTLALTSEQHVQIADITCACLPKVSGHPSRHVPVRQLFYMQYTCCHVCLNSPAISCPTLARNRSRLLQTQRVRL